MQKLLFSIVFSLLAAFSTAIHASNEQFSQGLQAFKAKDYVNALAYFEQAAANGLQSENLQYNIAVTHFKLGNYDRAVELFEVLAEQSKWREMALYNIARIEEKRGHMVVAFESFQELASTAENEKIRTLATWSMNKSKLLKTLYKPWDANIELGFGHDDNVGSFNKELDLNGSDAEDEFLELIAQGQYLLQGNRLEGYFITGSVYQRDYISLNEYGSNSLAIGLVRNNFWGEWKNQLLLDFSTSEIDGDYFESRTAVKYSLKRSIDQLSYRYFLRTSYHNAGSKFSRIGGWQNELEARLEKQFEKFTVGIAYRFELNDRNNFRIDPLYLSYSPLRHRIHLDSRYSLGTQWKLYGLLEYTKSDYSGENKIIFDNEYIAASRRSKSIRMALDAEYSLFDQNRIFIRYQYYDNSDNFANYEFNKEEISFGVRAFF